LPFRQPKHIVSDKGVLNITVNVKVTDFVVDWLLLRRRSYDSQIPGTTWRIKPGDHIYLRLVRITRPYVVMISRKVKISFLFTAPVANTVFFTIIPSYSLCINYVRLCGSRSYDIGIM